jgi:hypothetical protein
MQTADEILRVRGDFYTLGEMYLDLAPEKRQEVDVFLQATRREIETRRPFAET